MILGAFALVRTAFDGTTPAATLGDGGSTNRFITSALDLTTASTVPHQGVGAGFNSAPGYMYLAADTIDAAWTQGGGGTAGRVDWWVWWARAQD